MEKLYTVSELADFYGITARTIRFYESKGLLAPQRVGSTRAYRHQDRARLELVLRAKRLGFSLAEIKEYLSLYDVDTEHVEQLVWAAKKVRARINQLEQQRQELGQTIDELREIERQALRMLKEKGAHENAKALEAAEGMAD